MTPGGASQPHLQMLLWQPIDLYNHFCAQGILGVSGVVLFAVMDRQHIALKFGFIRLALYYVE